MMLFYLICFYFFTKFDVGRSLSIHYPPTQTITGCEAVAAAVRAYAVFEVNETRKVIQWYGPDVRQIDYNYCSVSVAWELI